MKRRPKNMAASVRQRLHALAKETNRPFSEVLQYFAMERFLYRLAQSPHASRFVLKGALLFRAWRAPAARPTMDIDLLGKIDNRVETLVGVVQEVCRQEVEADGLSFDAATVVGKTIKEDADYAGVRVVFRGQLENARIPMQIDVGFGDVVVPAAAPTEYPLLLADLPAPVLYGYSRESAVAEKFEAMVKLGLFNSRLKDFFDIWLLSRQADFEGALLAKAVAATFAHRGTAMSPQPLALTAAFADDASKAAQWRSFRSKARLTQAPDDLAEVVEALAVFLGPIAQALAEGRSFEARWVAPGLWEPRGPTDGR